jgi:hypothetical protein
MPIFLGKIAKYTRRQKIHPQFEETEHHQNQSQYFSPQIKYVGKNLIVYVQNVYKENYKVLTNEIK